MAVRRVMVPTVDNIVIDQANAGTSARMPDYWSRLEIKEGSFGLALDALDPRTDVVNALAACLQPKDPSQLGKGKDATGWRADQRRQLTLRRAWRVHNQPLWQKYCAEVNVVAGQMAQVPARQTTPIQFLPEFEDATSKLPGTLSADTNEHYLLSGVPKGTVEKILFSGMDERFSGANAGTMFGEGVYFAEDCAKADQYVRDADTGDAGTNLQRLLYGTEPGSVKRPSQPVYYVFVCRVVLGCSVRTKDGRTCLDSGASVGNQLWATDRRKQLGEIAGAAMSIPYHSLVAELGGNIVRFREFVIFNGARCYPEYLIAYSRGD